MGNTHLYPGVCPETFPVGNPVLKQNHQGSVGTKGQRGGCSGNAPQTVQNDPERQRRAPSDTPPGRSIVFSGVLRGFLSRHTIFRNGENTKPCSVRQSTKNWSDSKDVYIDTRVSVRVSVAFTSRAINQEVDHAELKGSYFCPDL